jgi:hypothetical protein
MAMWRRRAKLIGKAIAIENLRASALFENGEVRSQSNSLRLLNAALIDILGAAQRCGAELGILRRTAERIKARIDDDLSEAAAAARAWRTGEVGAAG